MERLRSWTRLNLLKGRQKLNHKLFLIRISPKKSPKAVTKSVSSPKKQETKMSSPLVKPTSILTVVPDAQSVTAPGKSFSIASSFESAVSEAFVKAQRELQMEISSSYSAELLTLQATVSKLSTALSAAEQENAFFKRAHNKRLGQLSGLLSVVERVREVVAEKNSLRSALMAWKAWVGLGRERRVKTGVLEKLGFSMNEGQVFRAWRVKCLRGLALKRATAARAQAEGEKLAALRESAGRMEALEREVGFLKEQLRNEKDSKTALQGDLQKVFLRGVNALNFEAMSVLQGGDGLPLSVAPHTSHACHASERRPSEDCGYAAVIHPHGWKSPKHKITSPPPIHPAGSSSVPIPTDDSLNRSSVSSILPSVCYFTPGGVGAVTAAGRGWQKAGQAPVTARR